MLRYLEENTPDLILLDVMMPDLDAFETMKQLRSMEHRVASIPVIFLTADESAGAERTGLSLGAMDSITKPFVPEVLLRVRHSIELIRLQRSLADEVERKTRENEEEFAQIRVHPTVGAQILNNIPEMPLLSTGARWHHERYGGGGYPDGLAGDAIPEEARIIAVADAYDAMTSKRSYRDVMPQEKVRSEIECCKETPFDPSLSHKIKTEAAVRLPLCLSI